MFGWGKRKRKDESAQGCPGGESVPYWNTLAGVWIEDILCLPKNGPSEGQPLRMGGKTVDRSDEDKTETEYPLIPPTAVCDESCQWKKERVPQARLSHGPHRRAFQGNPHSHNKAEEDSKPYQGKPTNNIRFSSAPSGKGTESPEMQGGN